MARGRAGRRDEALGQHDGERPVVLELLGRRRRRRLLILSLAAADYGPFLVYSTWEAVLLVQEKRRRVLDVEHLVLGGGGGGGMGLGLGLGFGSGLIMG